MSAEPIRKTSDDEMRSFIDGCRGIGLHNSPPRPTDDELRAYAKAKGPVLDPYVADLEKNRELLIYATRMHPLTKAEEAAGLKK